MKTAYLVIFLGIVLRKGYYVWLRGWNCYKKDRMSHDSLREYLLGNGATKWQAMWPFYQHALKQAFIPMKKQWRLWLVLIILGIIVFAIF